MIDLIQKAYAERVTLQTLGLALGRQAAYLGRLFHKEVGMTVRECVTRVRLEHAAVLILAGGKIEAVALGVGYQSKKNFYRQFRRHFETTPEVYRRRGHEPSAAAQLAALHFTRAPRTP
jgi:two-component system response regulator YesN